MNILTHRGLDSSKTDYFKESSKEAFIDQLGRGFGLEFDIQFVKDNKILISHNHHILQESGSLSLDELLDLIIKFNPSISALHLKYFCQKKDQLDLLLSKIEKMDLDRLLIFDVTIETAKYLKNKNSKLNLAPSVAHIYDIERFNAVVGGTLITLSEAIKHKDLFSWLWLDEWDRSLPQGGQKTLYNQENFDLIRNKEFKIALVMPELHATSPGLLGSESHQDARSAESLRKRFCEIIKLKPDAVCTDYPDVVSSLLFAQ